MSVTVIAGLGNPGADYEGTRHNVGFIVVNALAQREALTWSADRRLGCHLARWPREGRTIWLAKPQTYVNESGAALRRLLDFLKLAAPALAVVYDDLTLDVARLKLSVRGSAGGHNGVQSLLDHVGPGFARLRVGIGPRQPPGIDLKDFVLARLPAPDRERILARLPDCFAGIELLLDRGPHAAMNHLNRKETTLS